MSIDLDSVVVRTGGDRGGTLIALPRQSVRHLEVAADRDSYALRGAGIGAALGAAVGAITVLSDSCEGDELCGGLKVPVALGAAAAGAWVGLFAGALIGTSIPRVHWVRVPLPERLGLVPSRGRISLAILVGTYRVRRP